jgi:eukaryotic-like serine/threonine-protein kinase
MLAAASIFAVGLLVIVAIGSSLAAWKFRRDGLRIQAADRSAREQAAIAEAVSGFLRQDLLGQTDVEYQALLGVKPDPDIKVRTLLDRASERIVGRFSREPRVEAAIRQTIGETYSALGLYSAAEAHLERCASLARSAMGDRHPQTLNASLTLAQLYSLQGKYAKAEPLFIRAIEELGRVSGAEHPARIRAVCRLGRLSLNRGNYPQAESMLETALGLCRKVIGDTHYDTLWTMNDLALLYLWEGRLAESEALFKTALGLAREVRGEDHVTFGLMSNMGALYQHLGMYERADMLSVQALEGERCTLGAEHFGTQTATVIRASLLNKTRRAEQAEGLLTGAVSGWRRDVGEDHAFTCWALAVLAETRQVQGRLAELLYTQALEGWRRSLGYRSGFLQAALNPLAELLVDEGRFEKAEPLLIEAQKVGASLGDEGADIADTATALARIKLARDGPFEAEGLARRALAIRDQRRPDHWTRYDALSLVGAALAGQKKYAESELLLIDGYEGLKEREERIPAVWREKRPAQAGARIVELYDAWGKPDKAARWRAKLGLADLPADVFSQ